MQNITSINFELVIPSCMQYKKSCTIRVFVEHFRLLGAITGSVWHLSIQLEWGALSGDVVLRLLFLFRGGNGLPNI